MDDRKERGAGVMNENGNMCVRTLVTKYVSLNRRLCLIGLLMHSLPTGSVERGVLGVGSIPVAMLPSCHDMKTIAL